MRKGKIIPRHPSATQLHFFRIGMLFQIDVRDIVILLAAAALRPSLLGHLIFSMSASNRARALRSIVLLVPDLPW